MSRYDTEGMIEAQFEPGSDGQVLRNLLGITQKNEIEQVETRELVRVTEEMFSLIRPGQRLKANDIKRMHRNWLKGIYPWAGEYRRVAMSKGGFPFASPSRIPALMKDLEENVLRRHTPCQGSIPEVAEALAVVHVEVVLIHPFREGNGRIARLLSTLMALQAGLPPLDFSLLEELGKERYFAAIQAGMDRNYLPMAELFAAIIDRSVSLSGE